MAYRVNNIEMGSNILQNSANAKIQARLRLALALMSLQSNKANKSEN